MLSRIINQVKKLISKGFFHLFFANFLIQFMVFGSQMIVAGLLSPEDLGRIKILQTFVDVASIIGGGGLIVAVLKMIPENTNAIEQKFVLRYSLKYVFIFSFFIFIFLNILAFVGFLSADTEISSLFHVFSIIILLSPISLILVRYYQALEKFKRVSFIQIFTKFISVVLILIFTYYFLIEGYLMSVVASFLITLGYLIYDLRDDVFTRKSLDFDIKTKLISQIKNLSKFNLYGQISDQFRIYAAFFVGNYLITDREIFGQYSFALILIQGLGVLSSSVQQFVIPKFSKNSKNKELFFKDLKMYGRKYFVLTIVIFIVVQIAIPFLISFVFNGKYDESIPFFRVLLVGWLIYSGFTLNGPAFIGLGRVDFSFKISFYVLVLIIPVSIFFCYFFGIWGIVISYLVQTLISYFISHYYIKVAQKQFIVSD